MWQKLKQEIAIWHVGAMPGLAIIGLVILARLTGYLQFLELATLDNFLRWRSQENIDERILIIGIDENDISNLESYPISDRELANLIQALEKDNPTVIGVDIVRDKPQEPGHAELVRLFRQYNNIIGIEKVLSNGKDSRIYKIEPHPALPAEQIGFVDAILDRDGNLRRSLLSLVKDNELKFSLSIKLAENYLKTQGYSLDNVPEDPETMQFNGVKLTRFFSNSGGYINADSGGNQILLNFRSGKKPFRIVSLEDIKTGRVNRDWIEGNIVLIGITALSAKDVLNAPGIQADNPGLVYGVEIQAHAISQIISAVLDRRPLLTVWSDRWEYLWILAWGLLGISLARLLSEYPWQLLVIIIITIILVITICYVLLLTQALWLPVVPAGLVLGINGLGLTASLFYRDRQNLKFKLKDRQYMIKYMSSTIHNRPIQTLKQILRNIQEEDLDSAVVVERLKTLDRELRDVGKLVKKETIIDGNSIYVGDTEIDLENPFKEILYQVYSNTIRQNLPCFQGLKFKIVKFENIDDSNLTIEQKRSLCRFLEEALINVGKYAKDATRLKVICMREQEQNIIRVEDNGIGINSLSNEPKKVGGGTKQARDLAKQLRGNFRRYPRLNRDRLRALVLGLTEASQIDGRKFAPLPNVEQEISQVKDILIESKEFIDEEFTRDRIIQELTETSYPIIHIATHGQFSSEPEDTFLVTGNNQKLTLIELDRIIRSNVPSNDPVELISLTACQTAVGDERAALGLAGVAVQAGVNSALASLWSISDEATPQIIQQFYASLKDSNVNKAKALQQAQIASIERGIHPAYWASFIIIGNWL